MAHKKLFGICENKCLVETVSKEQYENDIAITQSFCKIHYCSDLIDVQEKTLTIPNLNSIPKGMIIRICFENGNSVSMPQLNINGTGAKYIRWKSGVLASPNGSDSTGSYNWSAGIFLDFQYDGDNWRVMGTPVVYESKTTLSYTVEGEYVVPSWYERKIDGSAVAKGYNSNPSSLSGTTINIKNVFGGCDKILHGWVKTVSSNQYELNYAGNCYSANAKDVAGILNFYIQCL